MRPIGQPRNGRRGRPVRWLRALAALALAVLPLAGLALAAAVGASRASTSCVVLPPEGPLPPHAAEARRRMASFVPEDPGGWVIKADRARRNRMDVAEKRIGAREAEQRGGIALVGNLFVPVLPTLYNDTPTAPQTIDTLQTTLFGANPTGSMTDYYEEVSYGNLNVTGTVFPWRRAPNVQGWYTVPNNGLGGGGKDFVLDAISLHDAAVDFGDFDNDGLDGTPNSGDDDGRVDILVVMFPTPGASCLGGGPNMWSHHSLLSEYGLNFVPTNDPRTGGGVIQIDRYFLAPVLACDNSLTDIGVYCHEMGHALGLPDLYDTEDGVFFLGDSRGVGVWSLMASGDKNETWSPAHMDAFSKERLGWLTYLNIPNDVTHLCLPPVETEPYAARVWSQGSIGPEYFLVENRQRIGFDSALAAPGLVIYHVDEDVYDNLRGENRVNAFESHKAIDVECADALVAGHVVDADDLDRLTNGGDSADVWCNSGSGAWTFDGSSVPDTRSYSGTPTGVAVRNIGNCTSEFGQPPGWVCADYVVGVPNPVDLCIEDCPSDNCNEIATCGEYWASPNVWIDNDADGVEDVPAEGIANKVWVRFKNRGPELDADPTVTLYAAKGTAGLEWPSDADTILGTAGATILAAGDVAEDFLTFSYPDLFDYEGHYCIGAVLDDGGPAVNTQANLSNNIAQVNSQVLIARAGGFGKSLACPGPYNEESRIYLRDGYNPTQDVRKAIVRVGSPPGFNDAVIPDAWTLSILPSMGPFFLSPGMKDSITVRMSSPSAAHGETAHVPITLWDDDLNVPIGGVTIDFRIDCNAPRKPENGIADWTNPPGDDIEGPTVLVAWDPVLFDVLGGSETIKYYEVFLSTDTGLPFSSVAEVAIDSEPLMPGFQWYDDLPRDHCPKRAVYKVRAIDGADGFGAFSDSIEVPCLATRVEGPVSGLPAETITRAAPNPFRTTTAIDFRLSVAGEIAVDVFNAQGERVRALARGHRPAGDHTLAWDGRDDARGAVGNGVYFYRIIAPGVNETRKIILAR